MSVPYKVRHRSRPTARNASAEAGTHQAKDDEPSLSPLETRADGNYAVGYGKPPTHTRFRKGRSGNPRGRPKKARNLRTEIGEAMNNLIKVRLGEHTRQVSTQAALILKQIEKGLRGDTRSARWVIELHAALSAEADGTTVAAAASQGGVTTVSSDDTDQAILEAYRQHLLEEDQQKLNHQAAPDQHAGTANSSPSDDEEARHE